MTTPAGRRVTMVAARAENGVIGAGGGIPWHIPEDFQHFKDTTLGHVLILGRTTHEGIGRPLPGRQTIVLTRDRDWSADGVRVAADVPAALALADELLSAAPADRQVMVGGGAHVYETAMPYADEQIISEIPLTPDGDTHYPAFSAKRWREVRRDRRDRFTVVWWERVFACGGT
ncbi:dihydrofolate reductase [Nocardioides sambongensis]|uniref:dihydrofolate reductase n=1 Tax=Nocardioides sambongensis TaxID=2589074 RepID=UPI0011299F3A|nr:dihydrofolate reductase [Nocardioides sambongensis]